MKHARGMTLIEIMIVLALVAVLAMTVAPLTSSWLRQGELTTAIGNFNLAVGRAKSSALRNNMAATGDQAVAIVCFNAGQLKVVEGVAGTAPACNGANVVWQADLASSITIVAVAGGAALTTLCFDNKGLPTTTDCVGATKAYQFKISAGVEHYDNVSI